MDSSSCSWLFVFQSFFTATDGTRTSPWERAEPIGLMRVEQVEATQPPRDRELVLSFECPQYDMKVLEISNATEQCHRQVFTEASNDALDLFGEGGQQLFCLRHMCSTDGRGGYRNA